MRVSFSWVRMQHEFIIVVQTRLHRTMTLPIAMALMLLAIRQQVVQRGRNERERQNGLLVGCAQRFAFLDAISNPVRCLHSTHVLLGAPISSTHLPKWQQHLPTSRARFAHNRMRPTRARAVMRPTSSIAANHVSASTGSSRTSACVRVVMYAWMRHRT
jgi:hypothetical protein